MQPEYNPFSPGACSPPPALVGREAILNQASIALTRVQAGRPEKSMFLVGLRGVGKTVLLYRLSEMAESKGYKSFMIEAQERKSLSLLLMPYFKQILFSLDGKLAANAKVKRGLRVLKSFLSGIKLKVQDIEIGLDIDAERGVADSGDLEVDLSQMFVALGEAAKDQQTAIAIVIDELQYLKEEELSALIMAMHKIAQKSLPVIIFGGGLPQLLAKAGKAKSYAERLFNYPVVDALNRVDAKEALQQPARAEHASFTDAALERIIDITKCYPYFLQEWGYQSWNAATDSIIDTAAVEQASQVALKRLDESFFQVRFDRLTPREKNYLLALAELGSGAHRSGDIAEKLQLDVNQAAPIRNSLIKKGMIYSPAHGCTAFTVPLFDDFMRRTMV